MALALTALNFPGTGWLRTPLPGPATRPLFMGETSGDGQTDPAGSSDGALGRAAGESRPSRSANSDPPSGSGGLSAGRRENSEAVAGGTGGHGRSGDMGAGRGPGPDRAESRIGHAPRRAGSPGPETSGSGHAGEDGQADSGAGRNAAASGDSSESAFGAGQGTGPASDPVVAPTFRASGPREDIIITLPAASQGETADGQRDGEPQAGEPRRVFDGLAGGADRVLFLESPARRRPAAPDRGLAGTGPERRGGNSPSQDQPRAADGAIQPLPAWMARLLSGASGS